MTNTLSAIAANLASIADAFGLVSRHYAATALRAEPANLRAASEAPAIQAIATRLEALAAELEQGHEIDPDAIRTEARRIKAQVEMIEEGLTDPA